MKEIIAIIRPKKVGATRDVLEKLGFPSMTATAVLGRGRQRGIAGEVTFDISPKMISQNNVPKMQYIPKRELSVIVKDTDAEKVIDAIIRINRTEQYGDGKIFVCPVENAVRVRTSEEGEAAIQ